MRNLALMWGLAVVLSAVAVQARVDRYEDVVATFKRQPEPQPWKSGETTVTLMA